MAFETREGQGSLFPNYGKKEPRQPDHTGKVRIGGVLYRLSAWEKESRNGMRWLSITADEFVDSSRADNPDAGATEKTQETKLSTKPSQPTGQYEFDDEIPF